jgi:hypothetical protein
MKTLFNCNNFQIASFVLFVSYAGVVAAATPEQMCVGPVCLGMDVEAVAKIDLDGSSTNKLAFVKGFENTYGLDAKGEKVWFTTGDLTKQLAAQFSQKVKTICAANFVHGRLKASDGKHIRIVMRPVRAGGVVKLAVTEIVKPLPEKMSETDAKEFVEQVRQRYGDAYSAQWSTVVTRPTATVKVDGAYGRILELRMPFESDRSKMLEQPGCSEKARID